MVSNPPRRIQRATVAKIALALLALLVVFEVVVRLIPPDAVTYQVQYSTNGGPMTKKSGTITDPATIARWRAAMTATPSGHLLLEPLVRQLTGNRETCAPLTYYIASYTFSWHGLPLEGVSSLRSTCTGQYWLTSGGIPDLRIYIVQWLIQP